MAKVNLLWCPRKWVRKCDLCPPWPQFFPEPRALHGGLPFFGFAEDALRKASLPEFWISACGQPFLPFLREIFHSSFPEATLP